MSEASEECLSRNLRPQDKGELFWDTAEGKRRKYHKKELGVDIDLLHDTKECMMEVSQESLGEAKDHDTKWSYLGQFLKGKGGNATKIKYPQRPEDEEKYKNSIQ